MKKTPFILLLSLLAIIAFLLVRHVASLTIVWAGIAETEQEALVNATNLLENATRIEGEPTQAELLKQAAFLDVPLILALIGGLFYYRRKSRSDLRKPALLGCFCSILCMPLHELLHAISIPRGATSYIGIIKGNFSAYAFTDACMTLPQCVCYYLVPAFALGVIPLIFSLLIKNKNLFWQVFLFAFALLGLIQTAPDWFGLYPVLKGVPHGATLQMSDGFTYWFF